MLTGLAVIGVARFLQQRQDFENATARSYQVEIARPQPTAPTAAARPRRAPTIARRAATARRRCATTSTSETRDTALLVGAGLIAGLTGAALLFSGLISSMRRPLEELVEASGRLAGGDLTPGSRSAASRRRRRSAPPSTRWPTELQRRAGERDQLDRMKDEFVLTASHELRSPLTSVQGFAELLMLEREQLSPKQADTVEIILDNTRHLVRLLNDLLDLARSDAGRLTIKPVPTEVGAAGRRRGAHDAGPDRGRRPGAAPQRSRPACRRSRSTRTGFAKYWSTCLPTRTSTVRKERRSR